MGSQYKVFATVFSALLGLSSLSYTHDAITPSHAPNEAAVAKLSQSLMEKAATHKSMIETQKEMAGKKADAQTEKAKALAEIGFNKYREQQKAHTNTSASDIAGMMVFVSLTMPDQVLKTLIKQADQYNIPVLIRGFYKDDFSETLKRIAYLLGVDLTGKNKAASKPIGGIAISPEHFKHLNITQVPAFVLIDPNRLKSGTHNITSEEFNVVVGNLSLVDAIGIFKQKASPNLMPVIQAIAGKSDVAI